MPSEPTGWRSSAGYDYVRDLTASDLAWEWLRRNKDYAQDFATLAKAGADSERAAALLEPWGLRFRGGPGTPRPASPRVLAALHGSCGGDPPPGTSRFQRDFQISEHAPDNANPGPRRNPHAP
jgi:hypothetical protein